jgi:hypothetical protein
MNLRCAFCGRRAEDCPGGIWPAGRGGTEGICRYCARSALRAFGEAPDASPAEIVTLTPRSGPWARPGPDDGPEAA